MSVKIKMVNKMVSIGVNEKMAKRAIDDNLPPAQKTMLSRLLIAGVRYPFAVRAIERGLTDNDIIWNQRLGRSMQFIEADKEEEADRREYWTLTHPALDNVPNTMGV